jgi:hypothetical protein
MSFLTINKSKNAINIAFENSKMIVFLEDGRELSIPLEWFPRLKKATDEQLNKWRLIGKGEGINWEEIDEDISIENLLE